MSVPFGGRFPRCRPGSRARGACGGSRRRGGCARRRRRRGGGAGRGGDGRGRGRASGRVSGCFWTGELGQTLEWSEFWGSGLLFRGGGPAVRVFDSWCFSMAVSAEPSDAPHRAPKGPKTAPNGEFPHPAPSPSASPSSPSPPPLAPQNAHLPPPPRRKNFPIPQ